ncbi:MULTISPECIES: hypothetical protein [unclassified Pseudoalteromonas]|nr:MULTISPECIES: hypothetical protein [unclassified Pseudoalteromonas]
MVYFKKHSTGFLFALSCTLAACSSQPSYQGNGILHNEISISK